MPLASEEEARLKREDYGYKGLLSFLVLLLFDRGFIHLITKRDMTLQRISCKHIMLF